MENRAGGSKKKPEKRSCLERSSSLRCRSYQEGIMDENELTNQSHSGWVNVLLGIWVIVSPFVLQYTAPRVIWSNVVAGVIVLIVALVRTGVRQPGWSWINVLLAIWIIISPFVLGFLSAPEMWNNIALGIIIGAIALHNGYSRMFARA
jgi:hypothetical protein